MQVCVCVFTIKAQQTSLLLFLEFKLDSRATWSFCPSSGGVSISIIINDLLLYIAVQDLRCVDVALAINPLRFAMVKDQQRGREFCQSRLTTATIQSIISCTKYFYFDSLCSNDPPKLSAQSTVFVLLSLML